MCFKSLSIEFSDGGTVYTFAEWTEVDGLLEIINEVKKGGVYMVVRESYPYLYLQDLTDPYDSANFELVEDMVRTPPEQQIITAWLDKLAYVLNKDTTVSNGLHSEGDDGLKLYGDITDIVGSADIYQYVENTYDQLKSQEIQKKSQKLLEQKEQLAKQLADVEKELEELK
jgi:hypothetical protein